MRGVDKALWLEAAAVEFDRLIIQSETMHFIKMLPTGRNASYYNPQVKEKILLDGSLKRRVRGTIGGDRVDYPGVRTAHTAALTTIKVLLNAVVSEDAEWATADIADFYLGTPLPRPEYMRINMSLIPPRIIAQHGLNPRAKTALVEINKGIYGLPQAGILAQERLIVHLAVHGYHPAKNTPCLFTHITRPIAFTLVVDDFGIKYKGQEHLDHLLNTLRLAYDIAVDPLGSKYIGISIAHDRTARTISLSMPGYIQKALDRFGVRKLARSTDSPMRTVPIQYGPVQLVTIDDSPKLSASGKLRLQQVVGVLLYYARCVDSSMLPAINKISAQQSKPTDAVFLAIDRLLQYAASHPNATITYHPSDMRLIIYSDASYLSETRARSRAGGVHLIGHSGADAECNLNGPIDCVSTIITTVVASAAEAVCCGISLRHCRRWATNNSSRSWILAVHHSHLYRQCLRCWARQQHNQITTCESHGHAFSLDSRSGQAKAFFCALQARR
jgi:hypothetical protein